MLKNIPSVPFGKGTVKQLRDDSDFDVVLPWYNDAETHIEGLAFFVVADGAFRAYYLDSGWSLFTEYNLTNEPFIYDNESFDRNVIFIGEDAAVVKKIAQKLAQRIEEVHGVSFIPYGNIEEYHNLPPKGGNCCSGWDSESVRKISNPVETGEWKPFLCGKCHSIHGIEYNGKKRTNEQILNEEWLFEESVPGKIIETGETSSYLVATGSDESTRLDDVIGLCSLIGGARSHSFSTYLPHRHQAIVQIQEGSVTGYLTWEEIAGLQIYRQLFVRREHRQKGVATELVTSWCKEFCEGRRYHVDEPNERSKALLRKIGHWNGSEYEAVEAYPLEGASNLLVISPSTTTITVR